MFLEALRKKELKRYSTALADFLCWREGYKAGCAGDKEDTTSIIDVDGIKELKLRVDKEIEEHRKAEK